MKFINDIEDNLREYIKENMGFNSKSFETDLFKDYKKKMEYIKNNFNNKRVKVICKGGNEFFKSIKELRGRVKIEEKENGNFNIKFYEGRARSRFNYLDLGLFEGFYAVLIIKEIEVLR